MKTDFHVATGMCTEFQKDNKIIAVKPSIINREKYIANAFTVGVKPGEEWVLYKYVSVLFSLNNPKERLSDDLKLRLKDVKAAGYSRLFSDHIKIWAKIWASSDVVIEGDLSAQQAIRFSIFHLNQTYTGKDERLNIGSKAGS
jgi:maltose phosphorylase